MDPQEEEKPIFGVMKDTVTIYDDILSPIDVEWEADTKKALDLFSLQRKY